MAHKMNQRNKEIDTAFLYDGTMGVSVYVEWRRYKDK